MPYRVTTATFGDIAGEWQRLLSVSAGATVFQSPLWLRTCWEHFGEQWQPLLLSVHANSSLVGVAPLMHRKGIVSFIGETDVCDYHDFIVAQGQHEAVLTTLFDYLKAQGVSKLHLSGLRAGSPTLESLPSVAARHGFSVAKELEEVSPFVELPGTWEEFVQTLNKKDRHELRRKFRRLEEADPHYRCLSLFDGSAALEAMGLFVHLMRSSREDKRDFMNPGRERFFSDLAIQMAKESLAKLFFLELQGERVASSLCFTFGNSYYLYNSGYDPQFARLSVGLLLKALCIKDAIASGAQRFDFLRGSESYKYDLGAQDAPVYTLTLTR